MSRDFEWSAQSYSVRDLVYGLVDRLPMVVQVTEGYCSNDSFHDFGAEQVLRVYDIARQERVVVRESGGRYLSIPCSYPHRVRITFRDGRGVMEASISDVANIIRKQPNGNFSLTLDGFGVLQPINVYNEPYLVAHTIFDGDLHKTNTIIPAYLKIALSVAVGLTGGTQQEFQKVLADFKFAAAACRYDCVVGKQEIIAFPEAPCDSEYEYIVPVMHIKIAQSDDWRTDYDGYMKAVPSLTRPDSSDDEPYEDIVSPMRQPPPTGQSTVDRRPQAKPSVAAPPIPARVPTKKSTQARNKPIVTGSKDIPHPNSMAACIAELTKFNVTDDSRRDVDARPRVAVISPQQPVSLVPPRIATRTPSSLPAAQSRSAVPHRAAGRPPTATPTRRPNKGPTPTLGTVSQTSSTAAAFVDADDDILCRDVRTLNTEEVAVCMQQLKMSEYADNLFDKDVDGEMLTSLDETILVDEFGFSKFNARKLMKFVKDGYRTRTGTTGGSKM